MPKSRVYTKVSHYRLLSNVQLLLLIRIIFMENKDILNTLPYTSMFSANVSDKKTPNSLSNFARPTARIHLPRGNSSSNGPIDLSVKKQKRSHVKSTSGHNSIVLPVASK